MLLGCAVFEDVGSRGQVRAVISLTTWEEWVEMGEQMKKAYRFLMEESKKYNKTSERARDIKEIMKGLDMVRNVLDGLVCAAFPNHYPELPTDVFYGPLKSERAQ